MTARDVTATLDLALAASGLNQVPPVPLRAIDNGEWDRFVTADVASRQAREIAHAAQ